MGKYFEINRGINFPALELHSNLGLSRFVAGYKIQISKEFHKSVNLTTKMVITTKLSNVGKSSYSLYQNLTEIKSGQILASVHKTFVQVNMKTRRPEPFSSTKRLECEHMLSRSNVPTARRFMLPSLDHGKCFDCYLIARNTEMDQNNHVTQSVYLDYITECAAQAAASGYYTKLKGDICEYCVKSVDTSHLGESHVGDQLTVKTWEDPSNPFVLFFTAIKNNEDIFHAMLEYYNPVEFSNL